VRWRLAEEWFCIAIGDVLYTYIYDAWQSLSERASGRSIRFYDFSEARFISFVLINLGLRDNTVVPASLASVLAC
jgi:hypothetical protein